MFPCVKPASMVSKPDARLENNVKGVVVTMASVISAAICEAGMLGMLVEIAVGLAGLVQFREAGTLVLE